MKSHIPDHEEVELVERQLFRSLGRDEPPAGARHVAAAALGLGGAALTSATAGAESTAAASLAAKGAPVLLIKWVGIGTLAGAVSLSAIHYAKSPAPVVGAKAAATLAAPHAPSPELQAPAAPEVQAPLAADSQAALSSNAAAQHANETPAALQHSSARRTLDSARAAPMPTRSPPEPPTDDVTTQDTASNRSAAPSALAAEVAILDEARTAVATQRGSRALELLDQYARRFPAGTLNLEATVLRIESLFMTGATSSAAALGHGFLAQHPASTHAARVRRLLAEHDKP
jgi:hypothetical protein